MSFSLKLLGGLTLADERGPLTGPAVQRHRLALLAVLATARPGSASRDKLMAWLWPERDTEPARRLLNQAVHALRQALGADAILSVGEDLQLDPRVVRCDVVAFEEALAAGAPDRAAALYAGPFLDGFHLDDAPEFERWVDLERDRLAAARAKALEALAGSAERAGDLGSAVEWWRARAVHDPYDSRVAFRLVQALEQMGNRAGALQHAAAHRQLLREELEIEPPAELRALVERLRLERGGAPVTAAEPKDAKAPSEPAEPSGVTARPAAAAPDRPVIQPPPVASGWSERPATRGTPRVRSAALALVLAACAMGLVWRAARTGE
ncbi:MAG TPA: BTAD domain-containing putative transcriptional regulator, partial [Gemmatimonadales bacterium]|nr:BTAD domain-containing putative transcriptional regulator [Gemmatimonadales bacterium]